MMDLINISIPNAALTALLGYLVVFLGLVLLMVVVLIQGKLMAPKKSAAPKAEAQDSDALLHESCPGFISKAAAFADERIGTLCCPVCGKPLAAEKWVNQGDQRYMNIFSCEDDGAFLVRVKFRKQPEDNSWTANKLVYKAEDEAIDFYRAKAAQSRRRGRGHTKKKKSPA